MRNPQFIASDDEGPRATVLIVDKKGTIGYALCKKLATEFHVVFVSSLSPQANIHVTFMQLSRSRKQIKELPNKKYLALFIVDNGEVEVKDMMDVIVNKAANDNAKLICITSIYRYNDRFAKKLCSMYKKVFVLVYGDMFGKMVENKDAFVQQFLLTAAVRQEVVVEGSGVALLYPVALVDIVRTAVAVLFHSDSSANVFTAIPEPITELSLARMLMQTNPLLKINFRQKKEKRRAVCLPVTATPLLQVSYPIARRLQQTQEAMGEGIRLDEKVKIDRRGDKAMTQRVLQNISLTAVFFIVTCLLLPLFLTFIPTVTGGLLLLQVKDAFVNDTNGARVKARQAEALFVFATYPSRALTTELGFVGQSTRGIAISAVVEQGRLVSSLVVSLLDAKETLTTVLQGSAHDPKGAFLRGMQSVKEAVTITQQLESDKTTALPFFGAQKELQQITPLLKRVAGIVDVLPDLFGINGDKTYLVLFQNNMELRSGGGFIGSYGLLTVKKGMVASFKLYDVYDADGQLKGHVEPPFAIRRYLKSPHWFLRDSNTTLDFPTNAKQAAFFLKEEVGVPVDGVIAVDLSFIKSLLVITGPLFLPDYDQTVSSETLFAKAEKEAQEQSFAGSLKKKNFLRSVATSLEARLGQGRGASSIALGTFIDKTISEKHLMFAFSDPTSERLFFLADMTATLENQETSNASVHDFLGVSDTNFGVNKANYSVKRVIKKETTLHDDGGITGDVTIGYTNENQGSLGGDYKNYLQIYLPSGSTLLGIEMNGVKQEVIDAVTNFLQYEKKGFVQPKGLEVERVDMLGKTVYGFLVSVPKDKSAVVHVSYQLPSTQNLAQPFTYELLLFKQPGTESDPFSFSFFYPPALRVTGTSSGERALSFTANGSTVAAQSKLSTDTILHIRLTNE